MNKDLLDHKEFREKSDHKDHKVNKGLRDHKVNKDHKVIQVLLV